MRRLFERLLFRAPLFPGKLWLLAPPIYITFPAVILVLLFIFVRGNVFSLAFLMILAGVAAAWFWTIPEILLTENRWLIAGLRVLGALCSATFFVLTFHLLL